MYATKQMDHAAYQERVRKLSDAALRHVMADAQDALRAYPENPNCGYYQDEVCYCAQELFRRSQAGFDVPERWAQLVLDRVDGMVLTLTEGSLTTAEARQKIYGALANETVRQVIRMAAAPVKIVP